MEPALLYTYPEGVKMCMCRGWRVMRRLQDVSLNATKHDSSFLKSYQWFIFTTLYVELEMSDSAQKLVE